MSTYNYKNIEPVFRITALINASYYNLPKHFSFEGESHDFWEFVYVESGTVVVQLEENNYMLRSGEILICKPNVFHKSWVWHDKPAAVVNIAFKAEASGMESLENRIIILNAEERRCMAVVIREAELAFTHFDNVPASVKMEVSEKVPFGSEQIICNRIEELMIYARRNERNIHIDSRLIASLPQMENADFSSWIQVYLHEHMSEKITLETIAKANFISISKLKRIFHSETGESVISYLTTIRINEAKRLMAEGKYTFSQIAKKIGFESIHYFSYVFKKQTGMTASEYVKLIRKGQS